MNTTADSVGIECSAIIRSSLSPILHIRKQRKPKILAEPGLIRASKHWLGQETTSLQNFAYFKSCLIAYLPFLYYWTFSLCRDLKGRDSLHIQNDPMLDLHSSLHVKDQISFSEQGESPHTLLCKSIPIRARCVLPLCVSCPSSCTVTISRPQASQIWMMVLSGVEGFYASHTYDSSAHLDRNTLQQVVMQLIHGALHVCQARAEDGDATLGVAV